MEFDWTGNEWPDEDDHRRIRRSIVRMHAPGFGGGSGLLVGPDLVLTCSHVIESIVNKMRLQHLTPPERRAKLAELRLHIGLKDRENDKIALRKLKPPANDTDWNGRQSWLARASSEVDGTDRLDFAVLRLAHPVIDADLLQQDQTGPNPFWQDFYDLQNPKEFLARLAGRDAQLFLYHFPASDNGDPFIVPTLSRGRIVLDPLNPDDFMNDAETDKGSSGAMVFAQVPGAPPFPIAMHRGKLDKSELKLTSPISGILKNISEQDPALFAILTRNLQEVQTLARIDALAPDRVKAARSLIDHESAADLLLGAGDGGLCPIQPVFADQGDGIGDFTDRLLQFDLPLSALPPSERKAIRRRLLSSDPKVAVLEKPFPHWHFQPLGSDNAVSDDIADAVDLLFSQVRAQLAYGTATLFSLDIDVANQEDYARSADLLIRLGDSLRKMDSAVGFRIVAWVVETETLDLVARTKGRSNFQRAVKGVKAGIAASFALMPLDESSLRDWRDDMKFGFDVEVDDMKHSIKSAWDGLKTGKPNALTFDFRDVADALSGSITTWVRQYLERKCS